MQLELLMNVVQAILGKLLPVIFLGASALAATSLSILIHIHVLIPNQQHVYIAALDLSGLAFLSSVGAFMAFQFLENMMEESAGVLREIEAEIMVKAKRRTYFYGGQLIGRDYLARLFRRRIIRVKMGEFKNIESGFALEFFRHTADNFITYVFMVNVGTKMWLL